MEKSSLDNAVLETKGSILQGRQCFRVMRKKELET